MTFDVGDHAVVAKPATFSGVKSCLGGLKGVVSFVASSGRWVLMIPDGELDELWFFTRELDPVDNS